MYHHDDISQWLASPMIILMEKVVGCPHHNFTTILIASILLLKWLLEKMVAGCKWFLRTCTHRNYSQYFTPIIHAYYIDMYVLYYNIPCRCHIGAGFTPVSNNYTSGWGDCMGKMCLFASTRPQTLTEYSAFIYSDMTCEDLCADNITIVHIYLLFQFLFIYMFIFSNYWIKHLLF